MSQADEILSVKNIFKVFGPNPNMAMEMLRKGADKNEISSKAGHVGAGLPREEARTDTQECKSVR